MKEATSCSTTEALEVTRYFFEKADAYYRYLEVDTFNMQRSDLKHCLWLALSFLAGSFALAPITKIETLYASEPEAAVLILVADLMCALVVVIGLSTMNSGVIRDPLSAHLACSEYITTDDGVTPFEERHLLMMKDILKGADASCQQSLRRANSRGNKLAVMRTLLYGAGALLFVSALLLL